MFKFNLSNKGRYNEIVSCGFKSCLLPCLFVIIRFKCSGAEKFTTFSLYYIVLVMHFKQPQRGKTTCFQGIFVFFLNLLIESTFQD